MCVHSGLTDATMNMSSYLAKFPSDPTAGRIANCGNPQGAYGYGTGLDAGGTATFTVSAVFENANGGNTGSLLAYQ